MAVNCRYVSNRIPNWTKSFLSIVTRVRALQQENWCSIPCWNKDFFFSPPCWTGCGALVASGYWGLFADGAIRLGLEADHLHLLPRKPKLHIPCLKWSRKLTNAPKLFVASLTLRLWRWRRFILPKRLWTSTELHAIKHRVSYSLNTQASEYFSCPCITSMHESNVPGSQSPYVPPVELELPWVTRVRQGCFSLTAFTVCCQWVTVRL
jgi:hypothetical protein